MLNALSTANISLKMKPSKLNLKTKLLNHLIDVPQESFKVKLETYSIFECLTKLLIFLHNRSCYVK